MKRAWCTIQNNRLYIIQVLCALDSSSPIFCPPTYHCRENSHKNWLMTDQRLLEIDLLAYVTRIPNRSPRPSQSEGKVIFGHVKKHYDTKCARWTTLINTAISVKAWVMIRYIFRAYYPDFLGSLTIKNISVLRSSKLITCSIVETIHCGNRSGHSLAQHAFPRSYAFLRASDATCLC